MAFNKSHKIFVLGTTAEFIKLAPVMKNLEPGSYSIWSTGQQQQAIPKISAEFNLIVSKNVGPVNRQGLSTMAEGLFWLFKIQKSLRKEFGELEPSSSYTVVVHGDTSTSTIAAFCARLAGLQVAHVEAGLRSGNIWRPFPEEINRILTALVAQVNYAPTDAAVSNLARAKGRIVHTHGNTAVDAIRMAERNVVLDFETPDKYAVVFLHRAELLKNRKLLRASIDELCKLAKIRPIIFILDPVTEYHLNDLGLLNRLEAAGVMLKPKLPFFQFQKLVANSLYLITDSGGQQQEMAAIGMPCLVHRDVTEDGTGVGANVRLSYLKSGEFLRFDRDFAKLSRNPFGSFFSPSRAIADDMSNF